MVSVRLCWDLGNRVWYIYTHMLHESHHSLEEEIIIKALHHSHLNVTEIAALPAEGIRKSVAVPLIKKILSQQHWFPFSVENWDAVTDHYYGAFPVLQKISDAEIRVHFLGDAETMRTTDVNVLHTVEVYDQEDTAIQKYLEERSKNMDGLPIDWDK